MENTTDRILVIEDDQEDYLLAREMLSQARGSQWIIDWCADYETGREKMFSTRYQAVLVDNALGKHNGLELIREAAAKDYPAPLILYTERSSYEVDLEAMQAGATLYLTKSEVNPLLLERAIRYAVEIKQKELALKAREAELRANSEALHESEARERARAAEMDALLDAVPAIVWVTHDPDARNVFGNRAAHEFLRVPKGKNLSKSAAEDEKPRNFRVFQNGKELAPEELPLQITAATGEAIRNFEEDVLFDDGSQAHLIGNVTPLFGENGRPQGAVAAFIDITERNKMELELQERESQLKRALAEAEEGRRTLDALMENVPEGITIAAGKEAAIRRVSRYGQEILGGAHADKTAEQVANEWKVYYEDGVTPMPTEELPLMRAIQRGEIVKNLELVQVNAAGRALPLSCNAGPIRDATGTVVGGVVAWRDITERKQAEALLKEQNEKFRASEERLRKVIENLPEGLIVVGADGDALHWNQVALKMHGYQQHEDELSFLSNLVDVYELRKLNGELVPFEQWPVPRLLRRESFEDYELAIKNKKAGWQRIFSYYGTPILNNTGALEMGIFAIHDITERKQAEDDVHRHNAVLSSINRIFQEAMTLQTEEELGRLCLEVVEQVTQSEIGFISEVRAKTGQMDIIAINDARWKTGRALPRPDSAEQAPTELDIQGLYGWVLQQGQGFYTNDPASHPASKGTPSGHPLLQSFLGVPLIYGGSVIGMVGLGNRPGGYGPQEWDTMETMAPVIVQAFMNKRAEQALRQSESNLRKLVEGNIIGINIRDAEGRIRDANSTFLNMTGYTMEDLQAGKLSIQTLTPPEFQEADHQAIQEVLQTGSCKPYEKEYIHKDGRHIPAMVGYTRLGDSDGDLIGFVLDLSELKATQSKIVEYAEKLQQSNRELEQFAFMASHDLQEPLRKIRLFGNSIYHKLNGKLDESTEDSFQRMINASERMQAMIQDLLELSRVSTQGRPFKPVDLTTVANEVVSDLEPRIVRTGGQVMVEPLPSIDADPIQMHQVLQNLISNGLKFHKPDVEPVIKVSGKVSRAKNGRQMATILVEDNGIGFEEEYFDQILQPFKRLQGRTEFEGNGIGLAIVKKIIDRHGGTISARSAPGQGATFIVTLPVKQQG